MMRSAPCVSGILVFGLAVWPQRAVSQRAFDFSCSTFPANTTAASLIRQFGAESVKDGEVSNGEEDVPGTLIFPNTKDATVEVNWLMPESKSRPERVTIRTQETRWRTPEGISIGTDLKTLERMNRKPFVLAGFDWDRGGAVTSWSGGRLGTPASAACRIALRVDDLSESKVHSKVTTP